MNLSEQKRQDAFDFKMLFGDISVVDIVRWRYPDHKEVLWNGHKLFQCMYTASDIQRIIDGGRPDIDITTLGQCSSLGIAHGLFIELRNQLQILPRFQFLKILDNAVDWMIDHATAEICIMFYKELLNADWMYDDQPPPNIVSTANNIMHNNRTSMPACVKLYDTYGEMMLNAW